MHASNMQLATSKPTTHVVATPIDAAICDNHAVCLAQAMTIQRRPSQRLTEPIAN